MSTTKIPVLVWSSANGVHTGIVIEDMDTAAVGKSPQDCVQQIRAELQRQQKDDPWMLPDEFLEPEIVMVSVELRPQFVIDEKHHMLPDAIKLKLPCVRGKTDTDMLVCSIPPIGVWFSYHKDDDFNELARLHIREGIGSWSPERLSPFLGIISPSIHFLTLPRPVERKKLKSSSLKTLPTVADPLGDTDIRKRFGAAFEREPDVADISKRITADRANVLLIGNAGSGKTTIFAAAVRDMERKLKKENPSEKRRFWLTSASRLIAGMRYLGQWEERLEEVIAELQKIDGVLVIENLLELVRVGGHGPEDSIGAFLVAYLQQRELRIMAEATPQELDACRRLLPPLADCFQVKFLPEFDADASTRVLQKIVLMESRVLKLEVHDSIALNVFRWFRRFRPYDAFPGRAAGFLRKLLRRAATDGQKIVSTEDALLAFIAETGLSENIVQDDITLAPAEIHDDLSAKILGQDYAVRAISDVILKLKAGLNDPARPLGVQMFSGPTGVGKTALAKALSSFLFGHGDAMDRMIRLDMSEYGGFDGATRLLRGSDGAPSAFIQKVRRQPFCVVLFDEIEKASPEVFDTLLSVFDEGRLTDSLGRVTNFQSSVLIMTSNLGAKAGGALGFGENTGPDFDAEAKRFFRPEFYNRIDSIVSFRSLDATDIQRITEKELQDLTKREGLKHLGLQLAWSDEVVKKVAERGYDRRYGARPLQRALDELVVTPLARFLAENPTASNLRIELEIADGQVQLASQPT